MATASPETVAPLLLWEVRMEKKTRAKQIATSVGVAVLGVGSIFGGVFAGAAVACLLLGVLGIR